MKKNRAFLKWAGGKYSLVDEIRRYLPEGVRLIEPFAGAGTVFLNTDYDEYFLSDINIDLINLYKIVKREPERFVNDAKVLFSPKFNNSEAFYRIRLEFNQSMDPDPYPRAVKFLYLNRHCYNGLCRYNSLGEFNVPFGRHKTPYFPQIELEFFAKRAARATFYCEPYAQSMMRATKGSVIYCDPPYVPLSATASFTAYHTNNFSIDDHIKLAELAEMLSTQQIPVLLSNHETILTRKWYHQASQLHVVEGRRTISCNGGSRSKVNELFALFAKSPSN